MHVGLDDLIEDGLRTDVRLRADIERGRTCPIYSRNDMEKAPLFDLNTLTRDWIEGINGKADVTDT